MRVPLVVDGLSARIGRFAVKDVSFRLEPGEVLGLIGENGAGKTTTLRLVMGMIRKDGGSVRLGSLDHLTDEKAFKRRVGFVNEESFFYAKMTVRDHLRFTAGFYPDWDEARAADLLARFELRPDARAEELSKGMKTKLGLVLALAHRPDVLLLDEPTSGLDPRSRADLIGLLGRSAHEEGCAVLFSSHYLDEVERIADGVLVLAHGEVRAAERMAAIQARAAERPLERFLLEDCARAPAGLAS